MTYGKPQYFTIISKYPRSHIGEYVKSKLKAENLILKYINKRMNITIFHLRIIVGA